MAEYLTQYDDFILKPMLDVLKEGMLAVGGLADGIETYPLYEYLFQSIFLKMTGFQEQKLKLIHWTIATYDADFRWDYLQNHAKDYYSTYDEKNQVFHDLIKQLTKLDSKLNSKHLLELFIGNHVTQDKIDSIRDTILDARSNEYLSKYSSDSWNKMKESSETTDLLGIEKGKLDNFYAKIEQDYNQKDEKYQNALKFKIKEAILLFLINGDINNRNKRNKRNKISWDKIKNEDEMELELLAKQIIILLSQREEYFNGAMEKIRQSIQTNSELLIDNTHPSTAKLQAIINTKRNEYHNITAHEIWLNFIKTELSKQINKIDYFNKYMNISNHLGYDFFIKTQPNQENQYKYNMFGVDFTKKYFKPLYDHRNRCAHNTLSYQRNLPTLEKLADENHQFDNYYVRFLILILIDEIFILLFREYKELMLNELP